jgi:hypothetical protein
MVKEHMVCRRFRLFRVTVFLFLSHICQELIAQLHLVRASVVPWWFFECPGITLAHVLKTKTSNPISGAAQR